MMPTEPIEKLTSRLGHEFKDASLLDAALAHPSLLGTKSHKKGDPSPYERLEFLGDRVLGLVMAEWLYALYPSEREGSLAKRHAALVNADALHAVAVEIGLEHHLRLAHGEEVTEGSRKNLATLSDAMEAVIGAVYLDAGLDAARNFIRKYWAKAATETKTAPADPKTALQEWAQGHGLPLPVYSILESSGPAHAPKFIVEATVQKLGSAKAEGTSKRNAEKAAASLLLVKVKDKNKNNK
jgi:ribonuclease-3